jgi:rubrerythrin
MTNDDDKDRFEDEREAYEKERWHCPVCGRPQCSKPECKDPQNRRWP